MLEPKQRNELSSAFLLWSYSKGDLMFSATLDSLIHYFSLMFKIFFSSSLCLKAPIKTHSDACSQTQGNEPSLRFLRENWLEMHGSEDIFHCRVPNQFDISTYNQGVHISFPFRVCVCVTFLWYSQKWNLISVLFHLIWKKNKHKMQTNRKILSNSTL